ncbi:hypothetical protein HYH03_015082 [Edaphochlamys debaryana]|uniref:Fucosyltransferase n=1 Tax=Edaphochlamys debaryana TaxID=47281 RepID=A0A835XLI2_9CHLO|nr:hypothetical protein HYH03_015082 [Edaphochlamys debaryana]|eukprot:KAG2486258.1 hypothetical protein HYH03_015082 [Edaphochlamys debaryana]
MHLQHAYHTKIHLEQQQETAPASALGRPGGPAVKAQASAQQSPAPQPAPQKQEAAKKAEEPWPYKDVEEVNVGVQTGHFFGNDFEGMQQGCTWGKTVINCRYGSGVNADTADALWYHIPSMGGSANVKRRHPKQLLIGMSMESSEYYPSLDNKDFMQAFDIESSYRTCSQVPVFYFDYNKEQVKNLFREPMPFDQKKTALVYVNSNCGAKSGRSEIMRQVMALNDPNVPTHSWGNCDRNQQVTGNFNKVELIHGYKFCVAMENSITKDYVTEKMWQALEAGCVPLYLGPHNVAEFLPDPNAIVDYGKLGSPAALMKELERLANNRTAYEEKMAWKKRKWEDLSPTFLKMAERSHVHQPHTRCQICRLALKQRYKPENYSTCLFNEEWMKDYKK